MKQGLYQIIWIGLTQNVDHFKLVSSALDTINATDLEKVVLSREFKFNLESSNPIEIFKTLAQTYPSAFTYCWFHPETGFWLGASPESLLKLEGRSLSTMALAGTQTFNLTANVEWDIKNRDEHAFVTDYLVDSTLQLFRAYKNFWSTYTQSR